VAEKGGRILLGVYDTFKLERFADTFISPSFVYARKPAFSTSDVQNAEASLRRFFDGAFYQGLAACIQRLWLR